MVFNGRSDTRTATADNATATKKKRHGQDTGQPRYFGRDRIDPIASLRHCHRNRHPIYAHKHQPRDRCHSDLGTAIGPCIKDDLSKGTVRWLGQVFIACQHPTACFDTIEHPVFADCTQHGESGIGQFQPDLALLAAQGFGNRGGRGRENVVLRFCCGLRLQGL